MENLNAEVCEICGYMYAVNKPHICYKENYYVPKLNLPKDLARELTLKNTIALINSQEHRIKELTQAKEQLSESYDHLEKKKDELLAERARLTEENERLRVENRKAQKSIDVFRELADKHALQYELRADKVKRLERFKTYFDDLFETGLEVANWYENGELKPFDEFYISALDNMRD